MSSANEQKRRGPLGPPVYLCHFCGERFTQPPEVELEIRFLGREPKVLCPECRKSGAASQ